MPISPSVLAREVFGTPHLARQHAEHEESKLRGSFGQNICRIGERDLVAVGVGTIDIVKAHGKLSYNFQSVLAGLEDLGINLITKSSDKPVAARRHFGEDQALRRGFRMVIDLYFVAAIAQQIDGFSNVASGKDAVFLGHDL